MTATSGQVAKIQVITGSNSPATGFTAVNTGSSDADFRTNIIAGIKSSNAYFDLNYVYDGFFEGGVINRIRIESISGCPEFVITMTEVG